MPSEQAKTGIWNRFEIMIAYVSRATDDEGKLPALAGSR